MSSKSENASLIYRLQVTIQQGNITIAVFDDFQSITGGPVTDINYILF